MILSYTDRLALAQYSRLERESVYQMVCGMMIVDKNRDPREIKVIEEIVSLINLSPEERAESRTLSNDTQNQVLKRMDIIKKCYLAKLLGNVAIADGKITREENIFYQYYAEQLGLPLDPDEL